LLLVVAVEDLLVVDQVVVVELAALEVFQV
jgi:hypothetical protein